LSYIEPANAQKGSGELPDGLLADSNCEIECGQKLAPLPAPPPEDFSMASLKP